MKTRHSVLLVAAIWVAAIMAGVSKSGIVGFFEFLGGGFIIYLVVYLLYRLLMRSIRKVRGYGIIPKNKHKT